MKYTIDQDKLTTQFKNTRQRSEDICKPLVTEDYIPQPITDVSPPKWHLAHTTWFFEQFVLLPYFKGYRIFDKQFSYLFNSYYNNMGDRTQRSDRGFMTRPTVEHVYNYRAYVKDHMLQLLESNCSQEVLFLVEVGVNHEQQHQELLVYDIKYILGNQPTFPEYASRYILEKETHENKWINIPEGVHEIGATGDAYCFDNELDRHKVYLQEASLRSTLVTNGEFLDFINDGGYKNHNLWHDEGWSFINSNQIEAPLYWHRQNDEWMQYTMEGLQELDKNIPVSHISFYEAFAFAEWAGYRLPSEMEWEIAAPRLEWGKLWEWTNSAYLPYPGFKKAPGALGEYNGKFMVNQNVLRGASIATTPGHRRITYRNFFHASSRWVFSGIRLAKK